MITQSQHVMLPWFPARRRCCRKAPARTHPLPKPWGRSCWRWQPNVAGSSDCRAERSPRVNHQSFFLGTKRKGKRRTGKGRKEGKEDVRKEVREERGKECSLQLNWDLHSWRHLVLEGVGGDPVGALEENGTAIDAKVEAQPCGVLERFLDQLYCTKEHLQAKCSKTTLNQSLYAGWMASSNNARQTVPSKSIGTAISLPLV